MAAAGALAGLAGGAVPDDLFATVQARQSLRGPLHTCHAGSLLAAFTTIEQGFSKQYPGVRLTDTSGGSVDLGRRFAAGTLTCDVYAPADHLVIEAMLKPARLADYTIVFARGRMVLAYMANDPTAAKLPVSGRFSPPAMVPAVASGWQDVLTATGVRISGAHPFLDPGGYRAHMIFELAQNRLKVPGLYNALLQHYMVTPANPGGVAPSLGKDFNFQLTYEHSAAAAAKRDPQYRYATLPAEIDLSGEKGLQYKASVTMPGLGTPGSQPTAVVQASPVEWGLTIPSNSRNRDAAIAFVAMLLGPSGRAAFDANGPAALTPARVSRADLARVPATLKGLVAAP
jgi:ABC-type molybdate transport system substrate-binding protein